MSTVEVARRNVNWKALFLFLVSLAVLGGGFHLLHLVQVSRSAESLLAQADFAQQAQNADDSIFYLEQFLKFRPADADAQARLALLLGATAEKPRERWYALEESDQALRLNSQREDVRRQAITLALSLRRFRHALDHLDALDPLKSQDVVLLRQKALCEAGLGQFKKAEDLYTIAQEVIKAGGEIPNPKSEFPSSKFEIRNSHFGVDLAVEKAYLQREQLKKPADADKTIKDMLKTYPFSDVARLAAARYFHQFGQEDQAHQAVDSALKEGDVKQVEVYLLGAEMALDRKDIPSCQAMLEKGLRLHSDHPRLNLIQARVELIQNQSQKALARLQPILEKFEIRNPKSETHPSLTDQEELTSLLIDLGQLDQATVLIKRLKERGLASIGFLEAQLLVKQQSWGMARAALEKVLAGGLKGRQARNACALLATCFGSLGNADQEWRAWRRALEYDPSWTVARLGMAQALVRLGKKEEALAQLHPLVDREPEARWLKIRLLANDILAQPPAERNWNDVKELLGPLLAEKNPPLEAVLLQADLEGPETPRKAIEAAVDKIRKSKIENRNPEQVVPWVALVELAWKQRTPEKVLPLVDEAERLFGPHPEWVLARARFWGQSRDARAREEIRKLENQVEIRNPKLEIRNSDWDRVRAGLAQAFLSQGQVDEALRLWRQLAQRQPNNLALRWLLLEHVAQASWTAEADRLLDEIRKLEGTVGPMTACGEAMRLVKIFRQKKDPAVAQQAHRYLKEAAAARPSWAQVMLLEGNLYDLEGQHDKALEKYQAGLALGSGSLVIVQRVLQLLTVQGRYDEIETWLRKLPEQTLARPELERLEVQILALRSAQNPQDQEEAHQRAWRLAQKVVSVDSKNYQDQLFLGQVAAIAGRKEDAERALRRARELEPRAAETWTVLILFLARTDPAKAERELVVAQEQAPPEHRPLVLASGYETLGRPDQAEKQYLAAKTARPEDVRVIRQLAGFYLRTQRWAQAEPLLQKLLETPDKTPAEAQAWARRNLALLLASQQDYHKYSQALSLLEENLKTQGDNLEDRTVRFQVLALHPAHRAEAVRLAAEVWSGRQAVPPGIQFLWARLQEALGNWPEAQVRLRALAAGPDRNLENLRYLVDALLRHKEVDEAQVWFGRLEQLKPPALDLLDLRVRLLQAQGRSEEAGRGIKEYAGASNARLDHAARLLADLGYAAEAEKLFRTHADRVAKPEAALPLAQFLGQRRRLSEALALCEKVVDQGAEAAATLSVNLLRFPEATPSQVRQVEERLKAALNKDSQNPLYASLLAELYDSRGRVEESVTWYRNVLLRNPHHLLALNNLAMLLALKGADPGEALVFIEKAIETAGPIGEFLDTRGVVYMKAKRLEEAGRDLAQAVAQAPSAGKYFHLAQVNQLAGNRPEAVAAFKKAQGLGLQPHSVHPLELPAYRKLLGELKSEG